MGLLAENKTRRRINKDPNNTKWTRDETTFGQKILRAQGWQPGQFLGAQDAPHSELHTAANASYIRVVLKDDMKGLGFQRSKEDEVTGLGVFADLLSRLNGKSDAAIEEDQQARLAIKTHHFVEKRWGPMRFVRGGLLVGDELKEVSDDSSEEEEPESKSVEKPEPMEVDSAPKESKKEKKSKKRKAVDDEDSSDKELASKSKKRRKEERKAKDSEDIDDAKARKKEKKAKKDKSRSADASDEEKTKDKKSKKEKKEKKEKKREKKEKRRREEAEASDSAAQVSATLSVAGTGTSTPTGSGTGTSTPQGSRNFVRSRFIAQKRQAVLDAKALNQIFMVKA